MTISEIKTLIAALRAETREESISPESLGAILDKIVDKVDQASAISPLSRLDVLTSTSQLPTNPTTEQQRTLFLIEGNIWGFVNDAWKNCGTIRGPQGPKGDAGKDAVVLDGVELVDSLAQVEEVPTPEMTVPTANVIADMNTRKMNCFTKDYTSVGRWQSGGTTATNRGYATVVTEDDVTTVTINSNTSGGRFGITLGTFPKGEYIMEFDFVITNGGQNVTRTFSCPCYEAYSNSNSAAARVETIGSVKYNNGHFIKRFRHLTTQTFYNAFTIHGYFSKNDIMTITNFKITKYVDDISDKLEKFDLIEESMDGILYYKRQIRGAGLSAKGYTIDARQDSETFGMEIALTEETGFASSFVPLMGADKVLVHTTLTRVTGDSRIGVAGVVAYDANKNPIASVYITEGGASAVGGDVLWDVVDGAEFIRFNIYGAEYFDPYTKVILYFSHAKVADWLFNDGLFSRKYFTAEKATGNRGCYVADPTSANYGKYISPGTSSGSQIASVQRIIVEGASYVELRCRFASGSGENEPYANFGGVVLDEDGNILETLYRIAFVNPSGTTLTWTCMFALPANAYEIRTTITNTALRAHIWTFTAHSKWREMVEEMAAAGDEKAIAKTAKERQTIEWISQAMFNYNSEVTLNSRLGLVHISDWHESTAAGNLLVSWVKKIENFYKEIGGTAAKGFVHDVINTGDVVENYLSNGSPRAYFNVQGLAEMALFVLGNHDQAYSSNSTERYSHFWTDAPNGPKATKEETVAASHEFSFQRYFENFHEGWGVTMPTGYDNTDSPYYQACYWHKDYDAQKVRLIGLDCIYRFDGILAKEDNGDFIYGSNGMLAIESQGLAKKTTEQETWLKHLLDETLDPTSSVYGYSVICMAHYPLDDLPIKNTLDADGANVNEEGGRIIDYKTNEVTNFEWTTDNIEHPLSNTFDMRNRVADSSSNGFHKGNVNNMGDILQNFQDRGGKFIAWISGHTHVDHFYYPKKYPNLLVVVIDRAGENRPNRVSRRSTYTDTCLCANFYAIDTSAGLFKIIRLGVTMDSTMRSKQVLCYDYIHKKVLNER